MKQCIVHNEMPPWQSLYNLSSNQFSNTQAFIVLSYEQGAINFRTLRRNKPNSTMPLALMRIFTRFPRLLAHIGGHLRLNAGFIDIYELFFGNVFNFFKYASTCLGSCSL